MAIDAEKIKKLREETGAGILEIKSALEEAGEDFNKAKEVLMKKVSSKAAKKADRTANDGLVYSYIHNGGKVGSMIIVSCETDFVAKTDDFKKLCQEVAMQVCTEDFDNIEDLLASEYIRDPSKKILDLVHEQLLNLAKR